MTTSSNTERARPWLKFWAAAWRSDPALQSCSLAARGLWIECLLLMHEAKPRGHLRLSNGQPIADALLARLVGAEITETKKLLSELLAANVFDLIDGIVVSRKMTRDEAKAVANRENGKRGGNPKLRDRLSPRLTGVDNPYIIYPLTSPERRQASQEEEVGERGPFGAHHPLVEGDAA